MTETMSYIENGLNKYSEFGTFEKFDFLLSSSNPIINFRLHNTGVIEKILNKLQEFRYEMAYDKGIEAVSARLDKVLAYEALRLSRIIFNGRDLVGFINSVIYYEINTGSKEVLQKEVSETMNS